MQNSAVLVEDFYPEDSFERIKAFADTQETPFLVVDSKIIDDHYSQLVKRFPYAKVYYAIKANPADEVICLLRDRGSNFDVASTYELDKLLRLGVTPDRCSYGNTIEKRRDIAYFHEKGVNLFATDAEADLRNIAEYAPGARVYVRILTEGAHTADWPLSRKFGCQIDMAVELLILARELGLEPYGLKMINLGGGFPANYLSRTNDLETCAEEIKHFLYEDFGDDLPEIILEPGRSLVANAGILVSEVVLISRKSSTALHRWVYTDVGKFSGLIETLFESIHYPIYTDKQSDDVEESVIAGPTCDSADIMYEDNKYELPMDLNISDRLYWFSTGAYTTSYSAVEFNGFPPLKQFVI